MKTLTATLLVTLTLLPGCSAGGDPTRAPHAAANPAHQTPVSRPLATQRKNVEHTRLIGEPRFGIRRVIDHETNVACYINRAYEDETISCVKL